MKSNKIVKFVAIFAILVTVSLASYGQQCKIIPGGGQVEYDYYRWGDTYQLKLSNDSDYKVYVEWSVENPENIENTSGRVKVYANSTKQVQIFKDDKDEDFDIDGIEITVTKCD